MIELCWSSALRRGGSETRTVGARDAHDVGIPIFIPFFCIFVGNTNMPKMGMGMASFSRVPKLPSVDSMRMQPEQLTLS